MEPELGDIDRDLREVVLKLSHLAKSCKGELFLCDDALVTASRRLENDNSELR